MNFMRNIRKFPKLLSLENKNELIDNIRGLKQVGSGGAKALLSLSSAMYLEGAASGRSCRWKRYTKTFHRVLIE